MTEYTATKTENPCNRPNMEAATALLMAFGGDNRFGIENIYLDHGAGMMWETIVCYRKGNEYGYQVLSPREWVLIQNATTPSEIAEVIEGITESQKGLLGL